MAKEKNQQDGFLSNLILNVVLPAVILTKGEKLLAKLGLVSLGEINPLYFFLIALAFPIFYGVSDLIKRKKWNIFSIFGVLNVLLTGTIGLFELSRDWIIAKEAGIPAILGVFVCLSCLTKKPLARILFFNENMFDIEKIEGILKEKNLEQNMKKTLKISTYFIACSFFVSATIQFFLASIIFKEGATPAEFNEQVGQMTWISYLAVFLPCILIMILSMYKTFSDIKKYTGLSFEESLSEQLKENSKK